MKVWGWMITEDKVEGRDEGRFDGNVSGAAIKEISTVAFRLTDDRGRARYYGKMVSGDDGPERGLEPLRGWGVYNECSRLEIRKGTGGWEPVN